MVLLQIGYGAVGIVLIVIASVPLRLAWSYLKERQWGYGAMHGYFSLVLAAGGINAISRAIA